MSENNPIEIWKPVKGWEGIYSVSSFGLVRRDAISKYHRIRRDFLIGGNSNGYRMVSMQMPQKNRIRVFVHKLVAQAFIGELPSGKQINHKNGIRDDNRVCNLEYVTPSENIKHSFEKLGRKPLIGSQCGKAKFSEEIVVQIISELASRGKRSVASIARKYGVSNGCMFGIASGLRWKHITREKLTRSAILARSKGKVQE